MIAGVSRGTSRASSRSINRSCNLVRLSRNSRKNGLRILIALSPLSISRNWCNSATICITRPSSRPRIAAIQLGDEGFGGGTAVVTSGGRPWATITCPMIRSVVSRFFQVPIRWEHTWSYISWSCNDEFLFHGICLPGNTLEKTGQIRVINLEQHLQITSFTYLGYLLRISFLSLLYNTSRARDTRALPRFSYLASL